MAVDKKKLPNYNHKKTEEKWQKYWDEKESFKFDADDTDKPKHYSLEMFYYPSGRLHMGHLRNYSIGDVVARYKMMNGFNVLHPMGADALGLPAENAAIKAGKHPSKWTYDNIATMNNELKKVGFSYDWSKSVYTCDPEYYGQQQKIFLDFYKKGLAYQKESFVNWDPVDNTVLANEQVVDGRGWRSGALVEKKKLNQWFFKVSDYAEELLNDIDDKLQGWPEKIRLMQKNWIGKSEGATVKFPVKSLDTEISVFTTRPDTLFGAAFIGISPNHPIAEQLSKESKEVAKFIKECNATSVDEETLETMEKKGLNTGLFACNPFDGCHPIPVYIANFVLMDYGTGAIFGCPAHDQRDFEFAKKYDLPIKTVVSPDAKDVNFVISDDEAYTEEGFAINSGFLNGLTTKEAKSKAIDKLEEVGVGKRKVSYRIRDWGVSRQRYWGCPIPVIHCDSCGTVPVNESDLPVTLPKDVTFDGKGNPLEKHPTWKRTKCPVCGKEALRETDTFDTFVDSSWYFARFIDNKSKTPVNKELCERVLPVDQYVGGAEHATMHLIYARWFTKAMRDCGYWNLDEPFKNLFNQGMVCHKAYKNDKNEWFYPEDVEEYAKDKYRSISTGEELQTLGVIKMSKSKCNTVEPKTVIDSYGADAGRMFVLSDSPADKDFEWTDSGIESTWKYINRLWKLVLAFCEENKDNLESLKGFDANKIESTNAKNLLKKIHFTIKGVTEDYETMTFNRAIAKIRELSNMLEKFIPNIENENALLYFGISQLISLISPITPHLSEELWSMLGSDMNITKTNWSKYEEKYLVETSVTLAVQVNGKLRGTIEVDKTASKEEIEKIALELSNVTKFTEGKTIRKVIVVPNKLVSVVAG